MKRFSGLAGSAVALAAGILAADATMSGFRAQDVRFYFLLFTNWMGDDHLRPGTDLDATQVRRTLSHLVDQGLATAKNGGWTLTGDGIVRLVDEVTDPRASRRFEEVVLLATVATSYADGITAGVRPLGAV